MDEKNAVATGGTRHDGYMNVLNRFGTAQDNGEAYHFAPETMVDDMTLAAHYEGNGLFTKIIDIPAEKAATREFDLGLSDEDVKSLVTDALEDLDWVTTTAQAVKWSRLFGGAIAVMLIDDGGRLEDPLNWNTIKGIDEIALFERAVVEPDYSYLYNYGRPQGTKQFRPKFGKPQFFRVYSQYGHFVVHESRCLTFRNGILPETTTQAEYRFWGVPEYARIKRALRETVTNHANGTKLLTVSDLRSSFSSLQALTPTQGLMAATFTAPHPGLVTELHPFGRVTNSIAGDPGDCTVRLINQTNAKQPVLEHEERASFGFSKGNTGDGEFTLPVHFLLRTGQRYRLEVEMDNLNSRPELKLRQSDAFFKVTGYQTASASVSCGYQTEETGRGGLALVQYSYTGKAPTLKLTWEDSQLSPNRTRTFTDEQGRTMREAEFRRTASVPLNSTLKITCTCPAGSDVSVYQLGAVLI